MNLGSAKGVNDFSEQFVFYSINVCILIGVLGIWI
jgi:hypothetical protein